MHFWKAFGHHLFTAALSASCKHAELQSLMHISISQMERPHRHIDVAGDKHRGLCLQVIFRKERRQQINKLPTLHPICKHCFFFFCSTPTLPSLPNPCFSPNCHTVITSAQPQAGRVTARSATFHLHTHAHTYTPRATLSVAPASTAPSCFIRNIIPLIQNPMGNIDL